uniref:PIP49_C domain-containing protein n=1 Tax=Mesocestoides corti TaxID=53468 RepID=A0A5K3EGH3_MESCO
MTSSAIHPNVAYQTVNANEKRQQCYRTLVLSPWLYISLAGFITALTVGVYLFSQSKLTPVDIERLEVAKCPACFGQSACPAFFRGDVRLATFYGSRPIHVADLEKSGDLMAVDLGVFEKKPAVLRRLHYPASSDDVDAAVCRRQRTDDLPKGAPPPRCVPRLSIWRWMPTSGAGTADPIDADLIRGASSFAHCASPRLLALIQKRYRERSGNPHLPAQARWLRFDELTLLFNLAINPHAVIARTFPPTEGWPLPAQVGACGRATLEEGPLIPLSHFVHAPVNLRLQILRGLFQLPDRLVSNGSLTEADSADFALYLGDYRWDVFGVDVLTHDVRVIQARHLLAVDLREQVKSSAPFVAKAADPQSLLSGICGNTSMSGDVGEPLQWPCLTVEQADALCRSSSSSDHNYWAVCLTALSNAGELLRDLPPDLVFSLRECIKDAEMGARKAHIEAALEIIDLELKN